MQATTLTERLLALVAHLAETDETNRMQAHNDMRVYDLPLLAFGNANDPLFDTFRDPMVVRPDHLSPQEWLPSARTVVSWFLPFTKEVRESNRTTGLPSEEWVSARIDGEAFNSMLRRAVVAFFREEGGEALAPLLDARFTVDENNRSNWSERHVGHAAGLGTFGLHRGLITKIGCAGRLGSVVTSMELPWTDRPYVTWYDYCAFLRNGTCGACIRRCPADSIRPEGKIIALCDQFIGEQVMPRFKPRYGCGKCYVAVPCEKGPVGFLSNP